MFQLIFFVGIGVLAFVLLVVLARQGKAEGGAQVLVEARQAVYTLRTDLLPDLLVRRIFARDDLDFVRSLHSRRIERLFLAQRKRIGLIWVERVRSQVGLLRHLHLGSARFYARLELKTELLLAWQFVVLLVGCRALQLAILVDGPYVAPAMVGAVADAATAVCEISAQSLAFLTGTGLDGLGGVLGGNLPEG